ELGRRREDTTVVGERLGERVKCRDRREKSSGAEDPQHDQQPTAIRARRSRGCEFLDARCYGSIYFRFWHRASARSAAPTRVLGGQHADSHGLRLGHSPPLTRARSAPPSGYEEADLISDGRRALNRRLIATRRAR